MYITVGFLFATHGKSQRESTVNNESYGLTLKREVGCSSHGIDGAPDSPNGNCGKLVRKRTDGRASGHGYCVPPAAEFIP